MITLMEDTEPLRKSMKSPLVPKSCTRTPSIARGPTAEAPGVGLYLSQQILHDLGGTITVDSVKDEYSEFVINLA